VIAETSQFADHLARPFDLCPKFTVSGVTVDVNGTPMPNVNVALSDVEDRSPSAGAVGYATSDSQGRFSIPAIRGRHFRIQGKVLRPGGARSDLLGLSDEAVQRSVTIVLKPTR
jgi:hypothetical protein